MALKRLSPSSAGFPVTQKLAPNMTAKATQVTDVAILAAAQPKPAKSAQPQSVLGSSAGIPWRPVSYTVWIMEALLKIVCLRLHNYFR